MSKKKKKKEQEALFAQEDVIKSEPRLTYTFRVLNTTGPIPIAKPNDFIQLTPAVQPVPIVPYTDSQGAYDGADTGDGYDNDYDYNDDFY